MNRLVNEPFQLNQPFLICYTFFSNEAAAKNWLNLTTDQREQLITEQHFEIDDTLHLQPDGHAVYLSVDQPDNQVPDRSWANLWQKLTAIIEDKLADSAERLGMTLYFGAEIPQNYYNQLAEQRNWLAQLSWPFTSESEPPILSHSPQSWGQLWQVVQRQLAKPSFGGQVYVVLYTASQKEAALQMVAGRLDFLELLLHKAYQQAAHYLKHRKGQLYDNNEKQNQLLQDIFTAATIKEKRLKLFDLSTENIHFLRWRTEVAELTQTIQINLENFQQLATELDLFQLGDEIFNHHQTRLQRELRQLQYDQTYYQAMKERLNDSLQLLRADITVQQLEHDRQQAEETKQQEARTNHYNQRLAHIVGMLTVLFTVPGMWQMFESMMTMRQLPVEQQIIIMQLFIGMLIVAIIGYIIWIILNYEQG